MGLEEITEHIEEIKRSTQYDILTPELKVLIELYLEREKGLHVNELARRLKGQVSKATIQKSLMRLDDQGLIKTQIGVIHSGGADRLARICRISGEATARYLENLINAIYQTLEPKR
jgi:predicted transcriptional regulator